MRTLDRDVQEGVGKQSVRVGSTGTADTKKAINELLDSLAADRASFTFVFFNPEHDAKVVSTELDRRVGAKAIAGTTGGEICSNGFEYGRMTGISLHGEHVRATADVIPNLDELSLVPLVHLPEQFARRIGRRLEDLDPKRHCWILLADSSAGVEDLLTPFFKQGAPETKLVGGSLVPGPGKQHARASYHGRVYENAAALVLLEYDRPFELFHHTHLEFGEKKLEVTGVSRNGRVLEELDGRPAAEAYADATGLRLDDLNGPTLAHHPLGFPFRGRPFVCSPVKRVKERALELANTVHPGDELQLLHPGDLAGSTRESLENAIRSFEMEHGVPAAGALFFNCLGRYLDARYSNCVEELGEALTQLPVAGFNTLGEQLGAMHTNHTLTGLLFG